jgi:very-short-patch-repair endonuclease
MKKVVMQKMFYEAPAAVFANAKKLRNHQTEAEVLLWSVLKDFKQKGFKFRRQHPIGEYIVDFYCHKMKLIIEVDGKDHDGKFQKDQDNYRSIFFKENNLHILRFKNEEVLSDLDQVINEIEKCLSPLGAGGHEAVYSTRKRIITHANNSRFR